MMNKISWKITISALIFILIGGLSISFAGCGQPPIASFSVDKELIIVGTPVHFIDQSTGKVTSWLWDFGDGDSSSEQNPSHVYAKEGDFSAILTVLNKSGNSTCETNIGVLQSPVAGLTGKDVALIGESIQFTNASSGDITSYSWDFGDGEISMEQNPSHIYNTAGSYNVTLTVSNDFSIDTAASQLQVMAKGLSVNITMCSSVTSDKNYVAKPDATYKRSDAIYVYIEVKGFQQYHTDEGFEFWVQLKSLKVFKPDSGLVLNLTDPLENHATADDDPLYVYFWYFLGHISNGDQTGEYRLEANVLDKQSGDSKAAFTTFVVK
jgi:PKD repeat protein